MYMYGLGSSDYTKNGEAKKLATANGSRIATAKQLYSTVYQALTDKNYTNEVLNNPHIQMQGYWGDLNRHSDQTWNRISWYVYYVKNGIPNNNTVISLLGNDATHSYATFLIDSNAAKKFLSSLDCGLEWFDNHAAPTYNPVTDTFVPVNY